MALKIAGKCPPEKKELEKAGSRGFEYVELYLEKRHLSDFDLTLEEVEKSGLEVCSIHTPHVKLSEMEWIRKADRLANELDAYLVVHSQHILNIKSEEIEPELRSKHGYENNPGTSTYCLRNSILDKGFDLVLDTAHLYISEPEYLKSLKDFISEHGESLEVIHLNDSTKTVDGLAFGEGEIPIEESIKVIKESDFNGTVVLEVMPERQQEALEKFQEV